MGTMTEKQYKEEIYKKASEVKTAEQLTALLKEIDEFNHDYGTIVYACMAAMTGAFNVVNNGKQGGITGFQAGCLGWEAVRKFLTMNDGPVRLQEFNNMLYPQYAENFEKTITPETWEFLQKEADKNLTENTKHTHPNVLNHWKSIKNGQVPFGYQVKEQ
jgi:hypothetical protein